MQHEHSTLRILFHSLPQIFELFLLRMNYMLLIQIRGKLKIVKDFYLNMGKKPPMYTFLMYLII